MPAETHDAVEVIVAKRDGHPLSDSQIDWMVDAYTRGVVADEQMSALTMAILLNGMDRREIARWTAAMIASGETLSLAGVSRPTVDKHSTGGVADTVTLVFAPLAASLGLAVAKLSGRGLGHTGGTLDKLESIPGFRTDLTPERFERQVDEIGLAVAAQSAALVPADGALYALRDATATVPAIPLIATSVMSKKLAVGTDLILLDVVLPDMDGLEVCRRIRQLPGEEAHTPVLMLTACGDLQDRVLGLQLGADDPAMVLLLIADLDRP